MPSVTVDPARREATLACDPFGFHGAYVAESDGDHWLASDPRALRRVPGMSTVLDPAGLHGYLCFSYVPTPHTIVPGVHALRAGDRLTLGPSGERRTNDADWRERRPFVQDEAVAITDLRKRLVGVVGEQLGSDRDVGVFLSGGLDSSLVAALLAELLAYDPEEALS